MARGHPEGRQVPASSHYIAGTPPVPFKEVFDSLAKRVIDSTVPKCIARHLRHLNTAREYMEYLTKRFDKPRQLKEVGNQSRHHTGHSHSHGTRELNTRDPEHVGTENGVGEMGETPRGRVDEEVAAATGPGTETTDHQWTDGVSLTTPASGPRDDLMVGLDLVKPPLSSPPPTSQTAERTTDGGSAATEDHRTAPVQPRPRMVSQKVDEKTGDATSPNAERALSLRRQRTARPTHQTRRSTNELGTELGKWSKQPRPPDEDQRGRTERDARPPRRRPRHDEPT